MPFSGSSREGGNGEIAPSLETGTAVAIYNSSKSARPFNAEHGFSGWGGARNRADRVSDSLSLNQASGIIEAAQFAAAIGLPFNRHVTIHWERAGVPDSRAAAATGRFLKLASDWIAKRGSKLDKQSKEIKRAVVSQFVWAWVRENEASGDDPKGSHVHILLHLPAGAAWSGWRVRRWLERISGKPYRAGIIRTARIGGTVRAAATAPAVYRANLAEVVGYVLKGSSLGTARALGLERIDLGGQIIGKRAGWAQNIGQASRERQAANAEVSCRSLK